MRIKAALLNAPHERFVVEEIDLEPPHSGEVQVKISSVGVCHSDWHLVTGATRHPFPLVAGHEGSGVVEAIGEGVIQVQVGDHVALNWAPSCGRCFYCLRNRPNLCSAYLASIWAGTMMDGSTRLSRNGVPVYHYCSLAAFAERVVVPDICCVPMPPNIPYAVSALIGCAVTTGVGAVLNTAKVEPGSSVAVFGVGGVGMSAVMGARLAGASRIIAIDTNERKLAKARECGASDGILAGPSAVAAIQALTEGRGVDYAIEAVGIPAVQEQCFSATRPGGTVVLAGLSPVGSATNLPGSLITREEKTIMGSYYGTSHAARDFPFLASLYAHNQLPLDLLVTRTYPLEAINEAYDDMLGGETTRGVIVFE